MADEQELDEHGLVIHKHLSTVLVVVPTRDYDETTLRYARSALYNVHVHTYSVSTDDSGLLKGHLQDEFQVDGRLEGLFMDDYSGILFCGGPGAAELADNADCHRLARDADAQGKLVAAWGEAVAVLGRAGIVRKRKVTGDPALREMLEKAGARYTRAQVVVDGTLVTGLDDASGFRFGKALVQVVGI